MKKYYSNLTILFLLLLSFSTFAQYKPHEDLGELFVEVQLKPVFPDSKTFVDAIPLFPVETIVKKYKIEKSSKDFDLTVFVNQNFEIIEQGPTIQIEKSPDIEAHIDDLWNMLIRKDVPTSGSLISLPKPYIVPGGRFNEMYYWDSYFTMLGLQVSGKEQLIEDMVANFAWLINQYGFIPNGTRTYYLSRSQPPYFSLMVALLAEIKGEDAIVKYLPELLMEYRFWMQGSEDLNTQKSAFRRVVRMEDGSILNRYWDNDSTPRPEAYKEDVETASLIDVKPEITYRNLRAAAESGWDFSSRWFEDGLTLKTIHTTEIIPVDLNSLLYHLETTIANAYALKNDKKNKSSFEEKAVNRKIAIQKYCWNEQEGFYMDFDFIEKRWTGVYSLAGVSPLFFEIADKDQAEAVAANLQKYFFFPGGMPSTLALTGQQWDAPNGWAPLQWLSYKGLKNYQYDELASSLKNRWLETVQNEYVESGKLLEKYNVVFPEIPGGGGEYPTQDGFGWTNGVYLKMVQVENR